MTDLSRSRRQPAPVRLRAQPLRVVACLLIAACPGGAHAQTERFDGLWKVELTCPAHQSADDDARGYTHRFTARVTGGELQGTHGTEGEPGYHLLRGKIAADGSATLRLDGIVNNPNYAIRKAQRGKPYNYRVSAQFEDAAGLGQRMTGRACEFRFTR